MRVSRRQVLRAAGVSLTLPWLEAFAQPSTPRRFVSVFTPNGTVFDQWAPTRTTTGWALSPILAPLLPFQSKLLVPVNVDLKSAVLGPGDGHQRGIGHLWTSRALTPSSLFGTVGWASGPSIDQLVADAIGTSTAMRSLELGVMVSGATVLSRMISGKNGEPLPPESDPVVVFERLFGAADPLLAARRRANRKSVLDGVLAEFNALRPTVSAADRQVLEAHATTVREVERRVDSVASPSASCVRPTQPTTPRGPDAFVAMGELQTDLLALALACDVTRVASLQWTRSASPMVFSWEGVGIEHHELSHHVDDDASARAALTTIHRWYAQQFARLLGRLEATVAGPGVTLLDQSVIVWGNELGQGNTHSHRSVPFVVAGGGGGTLRSGLLETNGGSHAELLLACAQAAGAPLTTFGDPAFCQQPMPGVQR
ncbi:MAG: DUF1552 domain-containing protein [Myxococcales bacterium]|nr:DUF1552 domain-containing protein [Myxococcales bacterium]